MPTFTGTEGNDTITPTDAGNWDVFALGGDDTVIIQFPGGDIATREVFVDGGNGFDILNIDPVGQMRSTGNVDEIFFRGSSSQLANVSWINVERVTLTARFAGDDAIVTGASEDWFNINGTIGSGFVLRLQTNGGNDRLIITGPQIGSDIDVGTGDDIVDMSGAAASTNGVFIVRGGDGNDSIKGSSARDQLYGETGNDTLYGSGSGDFDELRGGTGDDNYYVDSSDSVFEEGGEGLDTAYAWTSFTLPSLREVERLFAADPAATTPLELIGNEIANLIVGNAGSNRLVAIGLGDELRGGLGDDTYIGAMYATVVENAGEGFDTILANTNIFTPNSFTLAAGLSIERISMQVPSSTYAYNLTGNELANSITGNAGNNRLDGRGGVDRLEGGLGNDIYFVDPGDVVVEAAGQGLDYVYARATYALATGVEAEVFATADYRVTTRIDLTGNEYNNSITGSEGINTLRGGGGDDTLKGLGGNDVLDGGAGMDYMFGGLGNDIYYADTGDNVNESAGQGTDAVYVRGSFILMANSQVETLASADYRLTEVLDLTGNELANNISGNNGVNMLRGVGGNDSISGLDGNDILDGGAGKDNMTGGAGADTFLFRSTADSAVGASDELLDFVSGTDKIDLVLIDARSGTPGDDAFTYIGGNAFSNTAGELRAQAFGSTIHIFGDVNGDSVADFEIIANTTTIASGDFVF